MIEVVNQRAFNGPIKLETLLLSDNLLFKIDGRAFDVLLKLQDLKLNNNILQFISPNLLEKFGDLKTADFTNNKCVKLTFPELSLDEIETELMNCVAPIDFDCKFELIQYLEDGPASYICSPQKLQILSSKTRINKLKGKNLIDYGFSDIRTLIFSGQIVEFLPFKMAETFIKLDRIIVENSKLSKLQAKDFEGLKFLTIIEIRGNQIKSIDTATFNDVPQLEHLDLSSNEIKELPSKVFSPLSKMRFLKMSGNALEKLSYEIIARRNEIEVFMFGRNKLEFIDLKVLKVLRKVKYIDFSHNVCIDEIVEEAANIKKMAELFGYVGFRCSLED